MATWSHPPIVVVGAICVFSEPGLILQDNTLRGYTRSVSTVEFSSEGLRLVSVSDGHEKIWTVGAQVRNVHGDSFSSSLDLVKCAVLKSNPWSRRRGACGGSGRWLRRPSKD